jgi:hypothetical protein
MYRLQLKDFPEAKFARTKPARKLHKLWGAYFKDSSRSPRCGTYSGFHVGDEFYDEPPEDAEMCSKCASLVDDSEREPPESPGLFDAQTIRWLAAGISAEMGSPVLKNLVKDLESAALGWRDRALGWGDETVCEPQIDGETIEDGKRFKAIEFSGQHCILVCDNKCNKAWGVSQRPQIKLGTQDDLDDCAFLPDPDDYAFKSDGELGEAPVNPGTSEGGWFKPDTGNPMNKWCARECERSEIVGIKGVPKLRDFQDRLYNKADRQHLRLTDEEKKWVRDHLLGGMEKAFKSYVARTKAPARWIGDVFFGYLMSIGAYPEGMERETIEYFFERWAREA